MATKREENTCINPEIEEDGKSHLEEMLDRDEGFRRAWEANRGRREPGMILPERRLEFGLSRRELTGRIGTSQNRVYLIENGEANPTLDTLQRLADVPVLLCVPAAKSWLQGKERVLHGGTARIRPQHRRPLR